MIIINILPGGAAMARQDLLHKLNHAALERTRHFILYDGAYKKIKYPMGDVSPRRGVCTDVVIRSYRKLGIDLQKEVHLDMKKNFSVYPKLWKLTAPDSNIDHRRVPNLRRFFTRHGVSLKVSNNPAQYKPGDLVTWRITGNLPHIGIVVNKRSSDGKRPLVVHNIGAGPVVEDMLFKYKITGHYRYYGPKQRGNTK